MSTRCMATCLSGVAVIAAAIGLFAAAASIRASAHSGHTFAAGEPGDPKKPFRTVEIIMIDGPGKMAYSPDRIEAKTGEQIRFVLKNVGLVDHEFLIDSFDNNAKHKMEMEHNAEMAHHDPNAARLKPNTTTEILWRFTKAGTFEFACLIPGHYETGMKGTFVVR